MNIPDGFVNLPTSAAGAVVACAGVAICVRRTAGDLVGGRLPAAGLAGAWFLLMTAPLVPIAAGTDSHLLGGTLAVTLLGPYLGALVCALVTLIQAVFIGDGGVSALGVNIVNLALVPALVGHPLAAGLRRLLPRRPWAVAIAAGGAAVVSVASAALLFSGEYAIGGAAGIPLGTVVTSTLVAYSVVALVEGVVTGLLVRAVYAARPDLVWLARPLRKAPVAAPEQRSGPDER
ncbi:energy-coupling factor ABC transporter permease [Amycolatopsis sp. MtRt-6]|uniref:energy-coupling factor ABC transporter permease n=1 Tax=Amycolatopsis sp. MtRt-6 TaxID=2792782 RepID=UPI001A8C2FBF|nr:energy-coupling factor ABC transporter permease [Amycolatopsis sp. MtRt-6]